MLDKLWNSLEKSIFEYGPNILAALAILIFGFWVISWVVGLVKRMMYRSNMEDTLVKFTSNLLGWSLKIVLFITVAAKLGVETTSFAAILGAAGLAVGLALQGSLANFAGGALIMIFKPFKVGDLIEAQGELGVVQEIQIFTSVLLSPDNKTIILPNGSLSNGTIKNYSADGKLRVDLVIGVSYDTDLSQAKKVLLDVMNKDEHVLKDPEPMVAVEALADSSVNLAVRPWSKVENYWEVYFGITEASKLALDKAGIEIPYPHSVEIKK
ncbi:MAG: mechanosensitive ion channel [Flavobacteriaceae bacterium]|nr:mechanosensitive ion channel [Flavobacteriaceae bacterium]